MAHYLRVRDFDKEFENLSTTPIIINDHPNDTKEDRDKLSELLYTVYDKVESLSPIPVCSPRCKTLQGGHNVGTECPVCKNVVVSHSDKALESVVWIKVPDGITNLVNPLLWSILSKTLTTSGFNALLWLCDPRHKDPPHSNKKAQKIVGSFIKLGLPRGLNSFIKNYDKFKVPIVNQFTKGRARQNMILFNEQYKDVFFPTHVPLVNKIAFVVEKTHTLTYTDIGIRHAMNAARTMADIPVLTKRDLRKLESHISAALDSLSQYYIYMYHKPLFDKKGIVRHNVIGAKLAFTERSVIVSAGTTANEPYDGVTLPYGALVNMLQPKIANKLANSGMSNKRYMRHLFLHNDDHDPVVTNIIEDLLENSNNGRGIGDARTRYPTLSRLSTALLRIHGITKDSNCSTLHPCSVRGYNADYDGDTLSGVITPDLRQLNDLEEWKMHYGIHSLTVPRQLNNYASIPDTTQSTIVRWLEYEEDELDLIELT